MPCDFRYICFTLTLLLGWKTENTRNASKYQGQLSCFDPKGPTALEVCSIHILAASQSQIPIFSLPDLRNWFTGFWSDIQAGVPYTLSSSLNISVLIILSLFPGRTIIMLLKFQMNESVRNWMLAATVLLLPEVIFFESSCGHREGEVHFHLAVFWYPSCADLCRIIFCKHCGIILPSGFTS